MEYFDADLFRPPLIPRCFDRSYPSKTNETKKQRSLTQSIRRNAPTRTRILRTPINIHDAMTSAWTDALLAARRVAPKSWLGIEAAFRINRLGSVNFCISSFNCSTSFASKHQDEGEIELLFTHFPASFVAQGLFHPVPVSCNARIEYPPSFLAVCCHSLLEMKNLT